MKRIWLLFIMLSFAQAAITQEVNSVTLNQLHRLVAESCRLATMEGAIDSIRDLQLKNIRSAWLPKLDANAQATWQSDVISFGVSIPGISMPKPYHDQYKLTLDVAQVIWDGGAIVGRQGVAAAQAELDWLTINTEVSKLQDWVTEAFFAILVLDVNEKQMQLTVEVLNSRIDEMGKRIAEGVALNSTANQLEAEALRLYQQLWDIPNQRESLVKTIETIIQTELPPQTEFEIPKYADAPIGEMAHPNLQRFDAQDRLFQASMELTSSRRMPSLAAFATSGYGRPGLNMISNSWDFFTLVGAKASWNIFDWNASQREREQLQIYRSMNRRRKMAVADELKLNISISEREIAKLKRQLEADNRIIDLLEQSEKETASRLLNGIASATDYLASLNAVGRAKLEKELRELSIVREQARINSYYGTPK